MKTMVYNRKQNKLYELDKIGQLHEIRIYINIY